MLVSIIIVTRNGIDRTRECLQTIARNTPEPHEVVLVDNGSTDGTLPWLRELCADGKKYRLLEEGGDLGLTRARRRGIAAAAGEYLVLLQSDTLVTGGWLSGMLAHLKRDPGLALVAPMTGGAGAQGVEAPPYRTLEELEEFAREFRKTHLDRRIPVHRLAGYCLLMPRRLAELLLGESPRGMGKPEDDLCLRAGLAGYRLAVAGDVFIHHYGSLLTEKGMGQQRGALVPRESRNARWNYHGLEERLARRVVTLSAMERAVLLQQRGELSQAVQLLLEEGIRFSPDNPAPYLLLAQILSEEGKFREAVEVLEQIPREGEGAKSVLEGLCRLRLGQREEAQRLAQRALTHQSQGAPPLHLAGEIALEGGEYEQGERLLCRAIAADPGYAPPYTALARLFARQGMSGKALALAELGYMLAPQHMEALAFYHTLALAAGELPAEERRLKEALALFPQHRGLHYALIDLLLTRGDLPGAMVKIERAAALFGMDDAMVEASLSVRRSLPPSSPRREAGRPTLSLCMIVKNEAPHLPRALFSARGLADEIVVVDTGSTDRTADIAAVFGARVYHFPWQNDFAKARNFSLSRASCDWILVLDADEALAEKELAPLRGLLSGAPAGYLLTTRNYTESINCKNWHPNSGEYPLEEAGTGWTPSSKVRLFPNDRRIAFRGAVHELVEDSLVELHLPIHPSPVPVHHYGRLDQEKGKEKQKRYYELGRAKLARDSRDVKALMELAVQATELGSHAEAQELWERVLALEPNNCEAFFSMGYLKLATADYPEALRSSLRALELNPLLKEAAFNAAKCQLYLGLPEKALESCREILARCPAYPPALALASAAHLVLGHPEGAEYTEELSQNGFDCGDYLREHARGLLKGGREAEALVLLEHALHSSPDPETGALLEECRGASRWGGIVPEGGNSPATLPRSTGYRG